LVAGMRIGTGQRLSGWVAANKRTIRNSDPVLDLGETARAMNPRPRSCLSTPLVSAGNLVGVLTLYATARDAFSEEHHRVIEVVARQVTPAVQQSAEIQRTRIKLLRDTVTGLPKLEHFRDIASTQVSEATSHRPVSLIVVSVNPFVDGNEKQRAQVLSDDKVSALVRLTRQSLRAADMLFQYGTSRFVALLLHTDESTGSAIAKRITQAVSHSVGIGGHLPELADRIHISVATAPDHGSSIEDLLRLCLGNRLIESELPEHPGPRPPSIH
jgi:diguanylate cyclase (GGDEF)-like protein